MTTTPLDIRKPVFHLQTHTAGWKKSSDCSSHPDNSTPAFTPADTPPPNPTNHNIRLPDLTILDTSTADMDEAKQETSKTREDVQPTSVDTSAPQLEPKPQETGDAKTKKVRCLKHPNGHKKSKKTKSSKTKAKESSSSESESSSSSSSSSSTSESEDSESESSSSSEEDAEAARRRKIKAKKAKKLKDKRKAKLRKHKESTDDDSESESSDESSSEEEVKKRKSKARKKRRSKKSRKGAEQSDSEAEEEDDAVSRARAQLSGFRLRRGGRYGRGGRAAIDDKSLRKALSGKGKGKGKGKKGKRSVLSHLLWTLLRPRKVRPAKTQYCRGSKVDFVRVDQLWDSSIHNYKLTETAEDADANEYDQYVFTVRRKFDWENKYTDTVVDIKSKLLKEALTHVMGAVKGVSFAEETPVVDPNMLFLYLEELRTYMKELKSQAKSEKKKKVKKPIATKASHVKVLIKYLDTDYAETKKTLYPLLESNTITFDLLWALFKSNEIAYCPTYSNPDEPRAFKIEYATKVSSHFWLYATRDTDFVGNFFYERDLVQH